MREGRLQMFGAGLKNKSDAECLQQPAMKYFMRGFNEVSQICMLRKLSFIYSAAPVCL